MWQLRSTGVTFYKILLTQILTQHQHLVLTLAVTGETVRGTYSLDGKGTPPPDPPQMMELGLTEVEAVRS